LKAGQLGGVVGAVLNLEFDFVGKGFLGGILGMDE
jgi:hypothetical protein